MHAERVKVDCQSGNQWYKITQHGPTMRSDENSKAFIVLLASFIACRPILGR